MHIAPFVIAVATVGAVLLTVGLMRWLVPPPVPVATAASVTVDMAGAVAHCQRAAQAEFPPGLAQVTLDDHSSRFDKRSRQYRIFLQAQTLRQGKSERYYINCYVAPRGGVIVRFESLKDTEGAPAGGRRFWLR